MKYAARATIAAPPERCFQILVDGEAWPEWEAHVTRIDGPIVDGARITVHTSLSSQAFPVVVALDAPHRMTWTGGMPLGLFKGVRTFSLAARDDGGTDFEVEEMFTGLLRPLMARVMPDLQPSFDAMAAGLKARAEG